MASRDFLGGFGREGGAPGAGVAATESDDIELSLGLSLGGCFGADPAQEAKKQCLVRSSSIASICSLPGAAAAGEEPAAVAAPPADLLRTSSLPTEYMEDRLRRRAMQSQRRLEAKRKRLERRNSMNSGRSASGSCTAAGRDEALEQTVPSGFQYRRTVALQGTTSSSVPEQGGGAGHGEAKSPPAMNTSSDNTSGQSSSRPPTASGTGRPSNGSTGGREQPPLRTLRSLTMRTSSTGDLRNSMVEDMPMVSYKAEGPSGRKTDGFLYKYRKGEEVRIVCVCHGNFLTPAEFVRHAGGGDVTNPLRHIVVNPQQSVFL
ncbi:Ninja-family protein 3 [Dichanthelium oligosanthes]|uniref:Ninja-family protein n=1 Tax=Dichanthelium oligosanthes TaxID=888268 RepID=A0A1E5W437_9POAL|nr:Ninja-family protein 3 [Dichanthelium oligosanthes]